MIEAQDRNGKVQQVKKKLPERGLSTLCGFIVLQVFCAEMEQSKDNLSCVCLFYLFPLAFYIGHNPLSCILHNNYVPATGIFEKIEGKCQNLGHVEN